MANTTDMRTPEREPTRAATVPPETAGTRHPDGTDDPEVIRARIERTRSEMGHTIDQIQERLSPEHISQQVQQNIREATTKKVEDMTYRAEREARRVRRGVVNKVRENPVPLAMIGIGLGWLLMSNGSDDDETYYRERYPYETRRRYYDYEDEYVTGRVADPSMRTHEYESRGTTEEARRRARETSAEVRERTSEMTDRARERASETADSVRERAAEMRESISSTASERADEVRYRAQRSQEVAQQRAMEAQERAREQARRAKQSFWNQMESNPLAMGALALAAGTVVGLVIPGTEYEDELLGETRDQLVDEAKAAARETAERVQTAAQETGKHVMEEAKQEAKRQAEEQNVTEPVQRRSEQISSSQ